jgi:hypothetical protein
MAKFLFANFDPVEASILFVIGCAVLAMATSG